MHLKYKKSIILFFVVLAAMAAIIFVKKLPVLNPKSESVQKGERTEPLTAEAINGVKVTKQTAKLRPIAVMVENHPDSRPQAGLGKADIVYETLAEGGITRFMAVYQSNEAKSIGPVRSAREYFALLANEIGAVYAHVGGSNEVITQIKAGKYKDLSDANEYYNGDFFPRPKNKIAPHNIYTSSELLKKLIAARGFSASASYDPWLFKDDAPAAEGSAAAGKINIDFSRPGYEVEYRYATSTNSYLRFVSGDPQTDELSGLQLNAKNIAVQEVRVTPVPDDPLLQVDIELTGLGKAIIFQDGKAVEGTWVKQGSGRTRYYDSLGAEIKFNRGQIWVELVPAEKSVTWEP